MPCQVWLGQWGSLFSKIKPKNLQIPREWTQASLFYPSFCRTGICDTWVNDGAFHYSAQTKSKPDLLWTLTTGIFCGWWLFLQHSSRNLFIPTNLNFFEIQFQNSYVYSACSDLSSLLLSLGCERHYFVPCLEYYKSCLLFLFNYNELYQKKELEKI